MKTLAAIFLFAALSMAQTPATPAPMPTDPENLEKRADVMMARKEYREASLAYEKAIRSAPNSAILWNKAGIAYHQQLKLDVAQKYYQKAAQLNKNYAEAINNLGTIFYVKKKYRNAIRQYDRALKINPDSASIYSNLGTAYFARKQFDDAFKAYAKALQLDPEVFEHRSTVGILLQERSVEDRAKFHFFLAKTYAAAGVLDRSLEYLRKALEEGYKEKEKIAEDPAFAQLIVTDAYKELMANPPKAIPQ